jgi:diaminopimelate epimerase
MNTDKKNALTVFIREVSDGNFGTSHDDHPFTKAHGAQNDFLLTWRRDAPGGGYPAIARAICDRHTGIGADGWMLVDPPTDGQADGAIELYNSDGSAPEISGNGTRCAAALLIHHGHAADVSAFEPARASRRCGCCSARPGIRVRNGHGPPGDPGRTLRPAAFHRRSATSP